MITGAIKSQVDQIQTVKVKEANRLDGPVEDPIFNNRQQKLRWSRFKGLGDASELCKTVSEEVFPFIKGGARVASRRTQVT
ncbi:hypothetical protein WG628_07650 [Stenotrophomonas maltophilia]